MECTKKKGFMIHLRHMCQGKMTSKSKRKYCRKPKGHDP